VREDHSRSSAYATPSRDVRRAVHETARAPLDDGGDGGAALLKGRPPRHFCRPGFWRPWGFAPARYAPRVPHLILVHSRLDVYPWPPSALTRARCVRRTPRARLRRPPRRAANTLTPPGLNRHLCCRDQSSFFDTMCKSIHRRRRALPLMMTEMMLASWETIARRTLMIAQNTCGPAEYKRMVIEKAAALHSSTLAAMSGQGTRAVLAPWHLRATANAKRLRRRRRAVGG
jgi:hypothetical protein